MGAVTVVSPSLGRRSLCIAVLLTYFFSPTVSQLVSERSNLMLFPALLTPSSFRCVDRRDTDDSMRGGRIVSASLASNTCPHRYALTAPASVLEH